MKKRSDFEWDSNKDTINQKKHGVSFALAQLAFLDHNRVWKAPAQSTKSPSTSTGAFAYEGARISNNDAEASLAEHFGKPIPSDSM